MTKQKFIKDKKGNEQIMIKVDKTLKEMMKEKPSSRWDIKYWHPKYDYLDNLSQETSMLQKLLVQNKVISADTIRASRGESYSERQDQEHPYRYFTVEGILETGYDDTHEKYGSEDAYQRLKRSELQYLDIALARSGTGSLGKSFIFLKEGLANIVSDLYLIRCDVEKVNPFYIMVLLKTSFGKDQIERNEKGVSGQTKITVDMIEYFRVPTLPKKIQKHIESVYKNMSIYHDRAMMAKKKNDEAEHKMNLETAEKILSDLIAKTEAIIRSDARDVL